MKSGGGVLVAPHSVLTLCLSTHCSLLFPLITFSLLISGVFYQGNGEPPGRVTGTPVYDYIFENSNSSSTIIMNRLDTVCIDIFICGMYFLSP